MCINKLFKFGIINNNRECEKSAFHSNSFQSSSPDHCRGHVFHWTDYKVTGRSFQSAANFVGHRLRFPMDSATFVWMPLCAVHFLGHSNHQRANSGNQESGRRSHRRSRVLPFHFRLVGRRKESQHIGQCRFVGGEPTLAFLVCVPLRRPAADNGDTRELRFHDDVHCRGNAPDADTHFGTVSKDTLRNWCGAALCERSLRKFASFLSGAASRSEG